MKQKLALSCALIHKPIVLFLDEPTTGVDAVSRKEFWEMLQSLKKQGITIVVSTPYMDEAAQCDRIALIQKGEIMDIDIPENIIKRFAHFIYGIKADRMYDLVNLLRKHPDCLSAYLFGEYVHFVSPTEQDTDQMKKELLAAGMENPEIIQLEANIEDSFMDLMTKTETEKRAKMTESKNNTKAVVVKNLVKKFGDFVANDRLSFEVDKGEIFGFLGANGAGKTTAIKILCGLSHPTSGEVNVAGYDIYKQRDLIKKNIGYMSQKFSLYDDLTIAENIRFYGGIYGLSRKMIKEKTELYIETLGLQAYTKSLVRELPLGFKQKLAFSVAIVHDPPIVFLDEPTGGVDPITRRQFWELIYKEAADGKTIFVTTHYMDEAEYCDRVSIMVDGKIEALDHPKTLKDKYNAKSMEEVFIQLARG